MVFEKVREMICNQLDLEPETVTEESLIIEELGADSLDIVDLVMTIEEELGIEVPDEAIEQIRTVGDVVKFIESKR
ncbi:MAG: acyl carrier protein [Clostridia bacterium]|nr:acyl carrier protein [Clostridia bacterium]